jgi:predicted  nucleic acid-binding Zn-ribbon protein
MDNEKLARLAELQLEIEGIKKQIAAVEAETADIRSQLESRRLHRAVMLARPHDPQFANE